MKRVLRTRRCVLRYPSVEDAPGLLAAVSAPEFPRDSGVWGQVETLAQARALIEHRQRQWDDGTQYNWVLSRRGFTEPLGMLQLAREAEPKTWLLGYWLHPRCWGAGYTVEGCRRLLQSLFDDEHQECVWAGAALWNTRSHRVLEKLGFVFQRENPEGYRSAGTPVRTREYRMLRGDWMRVRS